MEIGEIIHANISDVTEIKSIGSRVRLTFDNL